MADQAQAGHTHGVPTVLEKGQPLEDAQVVVPSHRVRDDLRREYIGEPGVL